ncbi:hypothetical protein [uncultured Subdoligranulum sp.]|uniref:hypothetical protein n=1 Tax=uncultured Subdoligranulum sp. TaxID=512298 RepID=UPI00261D6836|nr:hypothetical protein [uncultured Subdoligranulum sp.]
MLDTYNTKEMQPDPGFTDDGNDFRNALAEFGHEVLETATNDMFVLPDGMDGSVEINEKVRRVCDHRIDYYLTTTEQNPGGIALQCLREFSVILCKSGKTSQNHWPPTVSHLTA